MECDRRGVTDAEQIWPASVRQPIHRDAKQFYIVKGLQLVHAVWEETCAIRDVALERLEPIGVHLLYRTLADDKRALPVAVAIGGHRHLVAAEMAEHLPRISSLLG